ncbi:hypothetical protein HAX54_017969 [Datura stramonium]|uniref:Uncharacterized protein n=1 Tax=Datura stramonium TaxID=4076 RepID=A0ABS8UNS4_DATST|nr:hypothetical protein [Datura stramonium]
MITKVTKRRLFDGPSPLPSANQVITPSKFQPTRGCAQMRNDKTETKHHLRDENTYSEEEFDEGDDSSSNGSSLGGAGSDSEEESSDEATNSPAGDSKPLRGDVLKAKTSGFRDNLCWQVKGVDKYFQKVLTTIGKGHLKWNIV